MSQSVLARYSFYLQSFYPGDKRCLAPPRWTRIHLNFASGMTFNSGIFPCLPSSATRLKSLTRQIRMSGTHCGLERRAGPSGQSPMLQIGYAACWIYSVQRSSYLFWRPLQLFWDRLYSYDSPLSHQLVQCYVWYTTILRSILHVHRRRGVLLVAGIVRVQSGNFNTVRSRSRLKPLCREAENFC